jgi:ABC-2 type transport system permease protein
MIFLPYILLLLAMSHVIYHMPWPTHILALIVFISLALVTFRAIGLVIASVANNMQEGTILVQLLYFPMLFLSGATFPIKYGPAILQIISKFIPATYLVDGIMQIIIKGGGFPWTAAGALIITMIVGMTVSMKLFRWEKEEKIRGTAKLWVLAVLLPFVVMGVWQWVQR